MFIVVYLGFLLVGYVLSNLIKAIQLGWLDRVFGLAFGALKAFLIIAVLVFVVRNFPFLSYLNKKLENDSFIYSTTEKIMNQSDIQKLIEKVKSIKNNRAKKLTIKVGGYNAQG